MLWELVLLGEPLVVMAPSPSESSETVLALVKWVYLVPDGDSYNTLPSVIVCTLTASIYTITYEKVVLIIALFIDEKINSGSIRAGTMFCFFSE